MGEKTDLLICIHEEEQRAELTLRPVAELVSIIVDQFEQLDKLQHENMRLKLELVSFKEKTYAETRKLNRKAAWPKDPTPLKEGRREIQSLIVPVSKTTLPLSPPV